MSFVPVMVYDQEGNFLAYAIKEANLLKLQSANLWAEHETATLNARLNELNEDVDIRAFWPHPQDPEVLQIVNDERFMPIEYIMAEVVDDQRSFLVWTKEIETNEWGEPTGNMVDGAEIDESASVIRYKMGKVPKNPSDVMWRLKAASEVVARRRAQQAGVVLK